MYNGYWSTTGTENYVNITISSVDNDITGDTVITETVDMSICGLLIEQEEILPRILDVFTRINELVFCFKNEFKNQTKELLYPFIKRYRMDRLIGKREKRIGLKK